MKRRTFLHSIAGSASIGLPHAIAKPASSAPPLGKAKACIFLWFGGGMAQIDTFDPKAKGDPAKRIAGSAYDTIKTAVDGVEVCQHLPHLAARLDRMTILRTVNHQVIDEHGAATNRVYTGRPVSGTVIYPSLGSMIYHQLGAPTGLPGYVLVGYPSVSRGPGFLGSRYGFLYLTDTQKGPIGLSRPPWLTEERAHRRTQLLADLRQSTGRNAPDEDPLKAYDNLIEQSQELTRGAFSQTFHLESEPDSRRERYGGEFGQRCLLARRLVQQGVPFVEVLHNLNFVNGTGWDTHNEGQRNQHLLIEEVDHAVSALLDDLEQRQMLDDTLIVMASEFGRPAGFDSGGGRGHQGSAFSTVLAGGGLRHQGAWGQTDELSKDPISHPVSVPDFHATIFQALGIDPAKELFDGDRPVPITDGGHPIAKLFTS